jgi:hypothetical protein
MITQRIFPVTLNSAAVYLPSGTALATQPEYSLCNLAKVALQGDAQVLVLRAKPTAHSRRVADLANGATLYTCDEMHGWYRVYFGGPTTPCGVTHQEGLRENLAKRCRSGWAVRESIEILSG